MSILTKNFIKLSVLMAILPYGAFGVQATNPRLSTSNASGRTQETDSNTSLKRSATNVIARSTATNTRQQKQPVVSSRAKLSRAGAVRSPRATSGNTVSSVKVSRAAAIPATVKTSANNARSAMGPNKVMKKPAGVSRAKASLSRATAVFSDISKIGGGYASCRDSYATCMDQFCAGANETYRRCFCSDRFTDFADTADALDSALQMLAQFQDNNLNAVDKTAAEVSAMYTASAGEAAIKRDTSASQELLNSISDVLSGKKKTKTKSSSNNNNNNNSGNSIGVLDLSSFSVSTGFDDVWGGGSSSGSGLFANNNKRADMEDMSEKEGKELFNSANSQCSEITRDACTSDAMFNLARSAYTVMITQDCNLYEKNLNAKKETVKETVRTAEKYLREARLEEYRKHNSADVNECLSKVEEAMSQPFACGEKYTNCMDPTGLYINPDTGKPIYSQALFGLNSLIVLDGTADVLGANKSFDNVLDSKKHFAASALDSCRDISETVWYEYKRSSIIRIAQAQDDKIQDVKDSCVQTIKECYDKQTGDLAELDDTESQSTGALQAVAARGMCYERVQACAALYGDPDGCKYDDKTKKLTANGSKKCGLQALLSFVDTVDSVKVAEGCEESLTKYLAKICPDTTITKPDPDNEGGTITETVKYGDCAKQNHASGAAEKEWKSKEDEIRAALELHINTFCATDAMNMDESNTISTGKAYNMNIMNRLIKEMYDALGLTFTSGCTADGKGEWIDHPAEYEKPDISLLRQDFYQTYYGETIKTEQQINDFQMMTIGYCYDKATVEDFAALKEVCKTFGGTATSATKGPDGTKPAMCELPDSFYETRCCQLGGTYTNSQCVIDDWPNTTKKDCNSLF